MNNKEAIELLKIERDHMTPTLFTERVEAFNMAISALQAQEAKTQLSREDTTLGVQKTCITCKHYPPESKWPCIDCDMRNPADRWEPQEAKHSKESSPTHKELDTISRQAAIDALDVLCQEHRYRIPGKRETYSQYNEAWQDALDRAEGAIGNLPSAQPEIIHCKDCIWYELPSHKITENCVRWMKSNGILLPIKPDDFCSRAERRTDAD